MPRLNANMRGALFALLGFALFSTHDAVIKHLGGHYSVFQIVFFRTLLGFPILTLIMMRDRSDGNLRPRHPGWIALRICTDITAGTAAFYAFSVLPLAQVYALLFASPLLITLLAIPILGERVRLRRGLAVLVGMIGVLIVIRPGAEPLGLGHLAGLVSATAGATSSIISRKIGRTERSVVILLYPMVATFLVMGAMMPFVYVPMPVQDLGGMAVVALFAVLAGLSVLMGYREAEAVIVAPMQYSQILWAALYGYLFFGEAIDRFTLLGVAIIIASGLYILFRESRADISERRPVTRSRWRPDTAKLPRMSSMSDGGDEVE